MLRLALPPLTVWLDNQGVVDGYKKGKRWCCASTRPAADLWREFWRLIDDIGCGIVISKCKGHATEVDVQQGRSTEFLRRGNDNADHFAGYGAGIEEHQAPNEADIVEYKLACRWYHWLAKLTEHWPADTQFNDKQDQSDAVETAVGRPARDFELHAFAPHDLCIIGRQLRCRECQGSISVTRPTTSLKAFTRAECPGPLPFVAVTLNQLLHERHERGHVLTVSGDVTWCRRCGCYASAGKHQRVIGLRERCRGEEAGLRRLGGLGRLRRGRHPLTNRVLGHEELPPATVADRQAVEEAGVDRQAVQEAGVDRREPAAAVPSATEPLFSELYQAEPQLLPSLDGSTVLHESACKRRRLGHKQPPS